MSKFDYVLLGNSAAAISAAEAIRSKDKQGSLAIVSAEDSLPYSPALTTYYISGTISKENIYYRKDDFYKDLKVKTFLGKPATEINRGKKIVTLGARVPLQISYAKLLIATGGNPQKPNLKGADLEGVFTLRTLEDAKKIKKRVLGRGAARPACTNAVIIGGGLIGLRAAYALHQLGLNVYIVVSSKRILSQNLDEKAAAIIQTWLGDKHFNILTETNVEALEGPKQVKKAVLSSGKTLDADIVIIGKGVTPNASFAKEAGIKVDRGIVVDQYMQTSAADVYAAGDVAQAYDKLLKKKVVNAIWPAATEQGRIAGLNMAGGREKYKGSFAMNSLDFYGLSCLSIGISRPKNEKEYEILSNYEPEKHLYRKLVLKNNVIIGAILVGDIDRGGIITGLIDEGVKVDSFKDALAKDKFGFMAFPKELRRQKMTLQGSS